MLQQWFYLANAQDQTGNLVADIDGANPAAGTQVIVFSRNGGSNQLWTLSNGNFVSRLNSFVLDVQGANTAAGTPIIAFPPRGKSNQNWTVNEDGSITNGLNGFALDVSGGSSAPASNLVANPRNPDSTSQQWVLVPDYFFTAILALPQTGFQAFTGDELTAYQAISQQSIGLISSDSNDVRAQYSNMNAVLSKTGFVKPADVPQDAWDTVVSIMEQEIAAVLNVHALFNNLQELYQRVFISDILGVNKIINSSALSSSSTSQASVFGIFAEVLASMLGELGPEVAAVAIAMSASIESGLSEGENGATIQAKQSELWGSLQISFNAIISALGSQFKQILCNQAPLMETGLRTVSKGLNSLFWNVDWGSSSSPCGLTPVLSDAMNAGLVVSILQMLMPSIYFVRVIPQTTDQNASNDIPSQGRWVEDLGGGFYNIHLLIRTDNSSLDTDFLQKNLWDNGVNPQDFYYARNGWEGFQLQYLLDTSTPCNSLITILTNQSSRTLTVSPQSFIGGFSNDRSNQAQTMLPGGSVMYITHHLLGFGNGVTLQVIDPITSSDTPVAVLTTHQKDCAFEGSDPWVDGQSSNNGFSVGQAQVIGSIFSDLPGILTIPIQD